MEERFGHEYELYRVNKLHITCHCARWVCDLPGAFCRFLRSGWLAVAFLKFSSKRRRLAGRTRSRRIGSSGKGENHLIPHGKGVKLMESNPRDYGEQCRFDAFCKKVLRNEARAYLRNMKRQREREAFFSDLSQAELDKLHIPKLTVFVQRDRGTGRPTKRERREIDSLMGEIYLDDDSETSGDSE